MTCTKNEHTTSDPCEVPRTLKTSRRLGYLTPLVRLGFPPRVSLSHPTPPLSLPVSLSRSSVVEVFTFVTRSVSRTSRVSGPDVSPEVT